MDWMSRHWLAVILFVLYGGILLRNAYVGAKQSGLSDYYVGGRNMSGVVIGISFFATFASTNSYIGHAGKGYAYGLPWLFMASSLVVFTWLSWRFVGPRLADYARNFDALTIPDFLGARFLGENDRPQHLLRLFSSLIIVFASLLYLIAIFKGAGHVFQNFFAISYAEAVAVTLALVVLYTSIGGFVSVVRTDVVQGCLMIVGALLMFYFVTRAAGGVGAITDLRHAADTAFLFSWNAGIPFVVLMGISLSGALKLMVDPRQLSRFYALKDEREARKGIWVALIGLLIVQASLFPIGIYAHLLLQGVTDTDLIVPTLLNQVAVFPIWASDFLMVAIVAAAMSSMDSVLLVTASTFQRNLVEPFRRVAHPVRWTRIVVVLTAALAALLALKPPGDIVEITIFSGSLYAACFLPAVLFGVRAPAHRSLDARFILGSMIAGVAMLALWLALDLRSVIHEVFPALLVSGIIFYTGMRARGSARSAAKPQS